MDFADIPVLSDFLEVAALDRYAELPGEWSVAVADVRVRRPRSVRDVTRTSTCFAVTAIAAMVNAVRPLRIPFVFGGDGASFCVPPLAVPATRNALAAVRTLGRDVFGLDLRIGLVPVSTLLARGVRVLVANFRSSPTCIQVGLRGRWNVARGTPGEGSGRRPGLWRRGIRGGRGLQRFGVPMERDRQSAWRNRRTVGPGDGWESRNDARIYHAAIAAVEAAYGGARRSHPVSEDHLELGRVPLRFCGEIGVRTYGKGLPSRALYGMKIRVEQTLGRFLLKTGLNFGGANWGRYRGEVVQNTDHRKFDDTLRILLSGTAAERQALEAWLDQRHAAGLLAHGMQVSSSSLMTCLIGDRSAGDHIHFVDGASGGYALAAVDLKRRLGSAQGSQPCARYQSSVWRRPDFRSVGQLNPVRSFRGVASQVSASARNSPYFVTAQNTGPARHLGCEILSDTERIQAHRGMRSLLARTPSSPATSSPNSRLVASVGSATKKDCPAAPGAVGNALARARSGA